MSLGTLAWPVRGGQIAQGAWARVFYRLSDQVRLAQQLFAQNFAGWRWATGPLSNWQRRLYGVDLTAAVAAQSLRRQPGCRDFKIHVDGRVNGAGIATGRVCIVDCDQCFESLIGRVVDYVAQLQWDRLHFYTCVFSVGFSCSAVSFSIWLKYSEKKEGKCRAVRHKMVCFYDNTLKL